MKYLVLKDHVADRAEEIDLKVGQALVCTESSDPNGPWPNWVYCIGPKGRGWVPLEAMKRKGDIGIAIKDYHSHELTVKAGDIIEGDYTLNGWLFGQCKGDKGWVPLENVKKE